MARVPTKIDQVDAENANIIDWRYRQLVIAGADDEAAEIISRRTDISLHDSIDLLEHHCPPNLMVAILT
jgi:hypothetical protein